MALGNVHMTDIDGNIGSSVSSTFDEKVCGLLFDTSGFANLWVNTVGAALKSSLDGKVIELNSLQDAKDLGITAFTGETESVTIDNTATTVSKDFMNGIPYYHIAHFFERAGGSGRLFICFDDCSTKWQALTDMQRAASGIISQIGVWTTQLLWKKSKEDSTTEYSVNLVSDLNAIAKTLADTYHAPVSILLSANYSKVEKVGTAGTYTDINFDQIPSCINNCRYVSVLLSQEDSDNTRLMQANAPNTTPVGTLGLALGTLAIANVADSIGWVGGYDLATWVKGIEFGFGNITIDATSKTMTSSTAYSALTATQLDKLENNGYIFLRVYEGLEGHFYFSKDRTCSDGDYCRISRNRVINKSRRLVRAALLPYVNAKLKVDPTTGQLHSSIIAMFTTLITTPLDAMATNEEISAIGAVSVPADQNVLVNKTLTFSYTVVPYGCAEDIIVSEGLSITA